MPDGKQTPELNRKCCKLNLRYFGETKLVFVKLHKLLKTIKLRVEFISVLDTRSVVCWNLYSRYISIYPGAVSGKSDLADAMHAGGGGGYEF